MPGVTTRTQITAENQEFYDRNLLERVVPLLVHTKWAQVRDLPKNPGTKTIKFRRYTSLAVAITPLSEGITPGGSQLSITEITAEIAQYGDFVTFTDVVDYESKDPVLMETGELLGEQEADTLDQLTRDILAAGTSKSYAGSGHTLRTQVADNELITQTLIENSVLTLKNNKAKKMTTMINPSTGFNTTPIPACYIGIVHPNVSVGFKNTTNFPGFVPVQKYPNQNGVMEGEIGCVDEVRFIETTNSKVFTAGGAGNVDVYGTMIFGANAYGISRISGEAMKNIIKPLGSAGTADPLNQRQTSGWKATFVAKILNNDFITRIESAI
jgi:N4-gp56 family major capsid protein